jgi:hypothetical protein
MHKLLLTALAAATLFAIAIQSGRAETTAVTTQPAAANSSLVREAAVVCGGNGCNPVHTRAVKRNKFKPMEYTKPVGKAS